MYALRPHHGLCMANFVGRGYDEAFTQNMQAVLRALCKAPDQEIRLVQGRDVICGSCPHLRAGVCRTARKVEQLDRRTLELCGLNEGETLSWERFQELVREKILDAGHFFTVCRECAWFDFCCGIAACRYGVKQQGQAAGRLQSRQAEAGR